MSSIGKLVRKSQASLFWCLQSLPKAKREALYTLYAFCRHLDNLADCDLPDNEKEQLLTKWQEELNNIYVKKVPATDIGRKIYKNCMRFKIQKEDFCEILNSAFLDFPKPLQAPLMTTFQQYIKGTAEIPTYIALLIIGGIDEKNMRNLAHHFGRAMQITNILKDIKDDALSGHIYLPQEMLKSAKITSTDPLTILTDAHLITAREQLGHLGAQYFEKTFELLSQIDSTKTRPIRLVLYVFKRYFDIMQKRGWEVISPKPEISRRDKLAIMFKVLFDKN